MRNRHLLRTLVRTLAVLLWMLAMLAATDAAALPASLQSYDIVLGQVRHDVRESNSLDNRGFTLPTAAAIDRSHTPNALYIADYQAARILAYRDVNSAVAGAAPDLIIGQADVYAMQRYRAGNQNFAFVTGLTVDNKGTLWVSDTGNGRVLGFLWPFDPNQTAAANVTADVLIGSTSYTIPAGKNFYDVACNGGSLYVPAMAGTSTPTTLCNPEGLATDAAGNLYVSDKQNGRVLVFHAAALTGVGASASVVIGQTTMSGVVPFNCNRGQAAPSASTLCRPTHLLVQGTRLFVADTDNNRVLAFDNPLNTAAGASATVVIGQPGMVTSSPGTPSTGIKSPQGLGIDAAGTLWVSDTGNNRVLGFAAPLPALGAAPSAVMGQLNADGSQPNMGISGAITPLPSASALNTPRPPVFDSQGRLFLPDENNNRVLVYPSAAHQAAATAVIGQNDLFHGAVARTKARGLAYPVGMAVDRRAGVAPHVYVADFGNSRILGWWDLGGLSDGKPADIVIGQNSMADYGCNLGTGSIGANSLCWPRGVAVDASGDLWVADSWNHRVLRFPQPFNHTQQVANLVLGQLSFLANQYNQSGNSLNITASGFYSPMALTFDLNGNLWVADYDNSRVLGFSAPFHNSQAASLLLIGNGLTSYNVAGCTATPGASLCGPAGLAIDDSNNLWVADRNNNRAILFSTTPGQNGVLSFIPLAIIGQSVINGVAVNNNQMSLGPTTLNAPEGISVELDTVSGKPKSAGVVVADTGNNRVLVFSPVNNKFLPAATGVVGQLGSFTTSGYNTDKVNFEVPANVSVGLWLPGSVLALPEGLFIGDSGNTLKFTPKGGSLQAAFDYSGNNRVAIIRGPSFPTASVDAGNPPDLSEVVDGNPVDQGAGPPAADLTSPVTPSPDLSASSSPDLTSPQQTPPSGGGGGCALSASAGAPASAPLGLGLAALLILGGLRRRRRA